MRWEVSLRRQGDHASRYVLHANITTAKLTELLGAVLTMAYPLGGGAAAVQLTRMDHTPEAMRARFDSEFYSTILYKDGRTGKRRKFKKTPLEKEWEEFFQNQKREDLERRKKQNDIYRTD